MSKAQPTNLFLRNFLLSCHCSQCAVYAEIGTIFKYNVINHGVPNHDDDLEDDGEKEEEVEEVEAEIRFGLNFLLSCHLSLSTRRALHHLLLLRTIVQCFAHPNAIFCTL